MNIKIIPFEDKYLDDIRYINVAVSRHPNKPLDEKKYCQYLYIDYYAYNSKENCFIAIDEDNDECVGYVISEPDLNRYKRIIVNEFIPEAKKLRAEFEDWLYNEIKMYDTFVEEYDSHLHMDVKPGHQHQGIGTMLLQTELKHLKDIGKKGLMLLTSKENVNANKFYEKNGLQILSEKPTIIRGIKL